MPAEAVELEPGPRFEIHPVHGDFWVAILYDERGIECGRGYFPEHHEALEFAENWLEGRTT